MARKARCWPKPTPACAPTTATPAALAPWRTAAAVGIGTAFFLAWDAAAGKVGISRLVLGRRERFVMLEARGKGIVVWTLRVHGEIRNEDEYFGHLGGEKPPAEQVDLALKVIRERTAGFEADLFEDTRDAALERLIAAKTKGRPLAPAEAAPAPKPTNVVGIMDALRRSLAKETAAANDTGSPAPEKAPAGRPKAKPRRKG